MNAKKMTLTLSILLIIAQQAHTAAALVLGGVGCAALGTIAKGPDKAKMQQLERENVSRKGETAALQQELYGQISPDGQVTKGLLANVEELSKVMYGVGCPGVVPSLDRLNDDWYGKKGTDGQQVTVGFRELIYKVTGEHIPAIEKQIKALQEALSAAPVASQRDLQPLQEQFAQELQEVRVQIAALEGARGGQGDAPAASQRDLQPLQEQFAKDLAQFKIDLDELQKRIDAEAGRLTALEEAKLNDRLKALEDAPVVSQKDLQALQALLDAQLTGFRTDLDREVAARELLAASVDSINRANLTVAQERQQREAELLATLRALEEQLAKELQGFRTDLDREVAARALLAERADKEAAARALSEERLKQLEENNALFEKRFETHASVSDQFAARLAVLEAAAPQSTTPTGRKIRQQWNKKTQLKDVKELADDAKPADAGTDAEDHDGDDN